MKKILKISLFSLLLALVMPFTLFLSGCGATPTNEVLGVFFQPEFYDEETGFAVFEIDLNKNTELKYKVNPSSWSGYAVTYSIKECPPENLSRFTLKDGSINIESAAFEQIKIEIHINNYVDTCIVRLKEYPKDMFLYDVDGTTKVKELEVTINAYASYIICPYGVFVDRAGVQTIKPLLEYDFDFAVTSNDETVISVPNENRLKICSVRKNVASAEVLVGLKNASGNVIYQVKVKVNVILNAASAKVLIDGNETFVSEGSNIEIDAETLEKDASGNYLMNYQMFVFSEDNRFIETQNIDMMCTISETKYISVSRTANQIVIESPPQGDLTSNVTLWTNLIKDDGSAFSISFKITVKF